MGFLLGLLRAFNPIRLSKKNALNGYQLDHLLVGSMYAEQQSAYLNSYETGLSKSHLTEIVETYWNIYNKEKAVETLQSLHIRNKDKYLDVVYNAFENRNSYVEILKSNLPDEEAIFEYYLKLFRSLDQVVPELIEQKVISDFRSLKRIRDSAWNYGRGVFLARCLYELKYLSEDELKKYLSESYDELKKYCITWEEYTTSYILGRAMWGGPHNGGMIKIAHQLLSHKNSPLKNKKYI